LRQKSGKGACSARGLTFRARRGDPPSEPTHGHKGHLQREAQHHHDAAKCFAASPRSMTSSARSLLCQNLSADAARSHPGRLVLRRSTRRTVAIRSHRASNMSSPTPAAWRPQAKRSSSSNQHFWSPGVRRAMNARQVKPHAPLQTAATSATYVSLTVRLYLVCITPL